MGTSTPPKKGANRGNAGKGRPKGALNKTTASTKAALEEAFGRLGGVPALVRWAQEEPGEFYKLWSKLVPADVKVEGSGPQGAILIRVVKE